MKAATTRIEKEENIMPVLEPIFKVVRNARLVAENERYTLYDYQLGNLTVSMTILKADQETRGHSHDDGSEVYYFLSGAGEIMIGDKTFACSEMQGMNFALIPAGSFHKVRNLRNTPFTFISIFGGERVEANRKYK